MIIWSGAIIIAGGVVSFAVSRRLNGEARIVGGYFAGFAASGLIAVLVVSLEEFQDQTQQRAMLTGFKELVGLAPAFGVGLAEVLRRRALHRHRAGPFDT
ncbi:MAG: hypothetical protein R3D30_05030 [Hyphomicrobiales bacterium]